MGKWRRHSLEFKRQVVERMKGCDNIHELARELNLERKLMYSWKYQFEGRPEKNQAKDSEQPAPETTEVRLRREIKDLKEALGQKAAELDFFVAALRRVERDRQSREGNGEPASMPKSARRRNRKAN